MSDYSGPGIYNISPFHAPEMELDVWGGDTKEGAQVKLYKKTSTATNHQFQIVAAGGTDGHPEKGDREYFIIAVNTGLYITAHDTDKSVTTQLRAPKDASIRWKLAYAGNGAFYINNVDGKKQLNVRGAGKDDGTEVIMYSMATAGNCQFILRAV